MGSGQTDDGLQHADCDLGAGLELPEGSVVGCDLLHGLGGELGLYARLGVVDVLLEEAMAQGQLQNGRGGRHGVSSAREPGH